MSPAKPVSKRESGQARPSAGNLTRLSEALGVPVGALLFRERPEKFAQESTLESGVVDNLIIGSMRPCSP